MLGGRADTVSNIPQAVQLKPSTCALLVSVQRNGGAGPPSTTAVGFQHYLSDSPPGRTTGWPGLTAGAYGFGGNCCGCCGCCGNAPGRGAVIG